LHHDNIGVSTEYEYDYVANGWSKTIRSAD